MLIQSTMQDIKKNQKKDKRPNDTIEILWKTHNNEKNVVLTRSYVEDKPGGQSLEPFEDQLLCTLPLHVLPYLQHTSQR